MSQQSELIRFERLFQALCDQTRLRLLSLMADGPVSVGFLADKLGESQPKTSRHLAYLRTAGLVYTARDGKWIYYGIETQSDPAVQDILSVTLQGVCGRPNPLKPVVRIEARDGDAYAGPIASEASSSQWSPNEIDVHLL